MSIKKKYLSIFTDFSSMEATLHTHSYFLNKLKNYFDKIYIINHQNLKFFPIFARKLDFESNDNLYNDDYKSLKFVREYPKNFEFYNPKSSKDLIEFVKDKKLIAISIIGRKLLDFKTHFLLKKLKIPQIQVINIGYMTQGSNVSLKHLKLTLLYLTNQILGQKLFSLMCILKILPQIDIQFTSNQKIFTYINKNLFKKFYAKEFIVVNSVPYDISLDSKNLSEDCIVHLDASLNYHHELELRGKLSKNIIDQHYFYLEKFLKKLSLKFNKKVLVCIHPLYSLEEHQNYFKDFKVLKFKTRDSIYKAFLVTVFDSGAVVDAILLKKRIIGIISDYMSINEIQHSKSWSDRVGYLSLNTKKDFNFDAEKILYELNKRIFHYDKYCSSYHCYEPGKYGTDKIIDTIKKRYF